MKDEIVASGVFPDVAAANGLFWLVARLGDPRQAGHVALFMWDGERVSQIRELSRIAVPAGAPSFPKVDIAGGEIWFAYHDGAMGILRNATTSETISLAPCQNNDPICFGHGYVAWQGAAADHWPITRMNLLTREKVDAGLGQGTGLSRVLADGRVVLVDADRTIVPGGTRPSWAGDLVVVESRTDRGVLGRLEDGRERMLWRDSQIITPRCAFEPSLGLYGVAGWSNQDGRIRAAVLQAADFALPPPEPVAPINKPCWVGWFEFALPAVNPPGNCIVACDPIGAAVSPGGMTLPTIAATRQPMLGPIIGKYCTAGTVEEIERQATMTSHRAVAYWDRTRRWPRLPTLPPNAWLCVKAYCLKTETPHSFEQDVATYVAELAPRQVAIVCQCYTNNTDHTDNLAALVPVYARLAKIPNVVALLVFSDAGRDTGLNHHPEVRDLWQQLANSVTTPPITVMTAHPTFTITEPTFPIIAQVDASGTFLLRCVYALAVGAGEPDWIDWRYSTAGQHGPWTVDAINHGHDRDHSFRLKPGTYWISAKAKNAEGSHETGAERKIVIVAATTQPPTEPPPTQPPTQPPTAVGMPLATHDGAHFLKVGANGVVDARAASEAEASKFVITPDWDHVTLFVPALQRYAHALNGGGTTMVVNKTEVGAHEMFRLIKRGSGFALQANNGQYVCAESGGGGNVVVNRNSSAEWETFYGPLPTGGVVEPLRAEQGRFRTDSDWMVPRCYSVFHAPALVRDGRLDELGRLFGRAHQARCNSVRVFGGWHFIGGGLAPYSQTDTRWFGWMETVLQEAASRGLYVTLSYFCDAQVLVPDANARIRLFEGLASWAVDKPSLIVMAANEARKNGWSEADDPALLDLVRRFRAINHTTLIGASDPLDVGGDGSSVDDYNARQTRIAGAGVDFLLVHPNRKDRYAWVDHLYGSAQTPPAIGFNGRCWIEEPMGGAGRDVPGRRDASPIAHISAACVGAMVGAYTYMHRQLESDECPGLVESGVAADIPGSPDYRFINATLSGSPVARFTEFDKCRTTTNGSKGWAVAYGAREGDLEYAPGWNEVSRTRWHDGTGTCVLTEVSR